MSLCTRVIPLLHVKNQTLVKGVHLEGLRVLGKPEEFAAKYEAEGADELVFIDLVASLYQRPFQEEVVKRVADRVFIPFTVGGGIRTVEDARKLLLAGADKIAINTAAVKRPELITEVAEVLGCQSVVLYVEAKKRDGWYEALTDNARESTGLEVVDWCQKAVELGAGEILLTSVDREGVGSGYDCELVRSVSNAVAVPVIAHGGAGDPEDLVQAIQSGAHAVAASSLFHYCYMSKLEHSEVGAGNTEFLKGKRGSWSVKGNTITEVKTFLFDQGLSVRQQSTVTS